jgi:alkenylglycerophosphocholine/alkenylglycerophosphoethanolamine hydrolase
MPMIEELMETFPASSKPNPNPALSAARLPAVAILISGALAVLGVEINRSGLTVVFKPLTTVLLFAVVGRPSSRFAWLVAAGISFSLLGDVALLKEGQPAFVIGLGGFLLAHLLYVAAFVRVGRLSALVAKVAAVMVLLTGLLLLTVLPGAVGVRIPTVIYAGAITTMVISALSIRRSALPGAAFVMAGAILFYVSDSSLALDRFHRSIPHVSLVTMGVYWLGQLGIALGARTAGQNVVKNAIRSRF